MTAAGAMPGQDDLARPQLAAKAELRLDPVTHQPVLLFPEGLLQLNDAAHAIVSLCDGTRTLGEVMQSLAAEFDCSPGRLRADVAACLQDLQQRRLLHFLPPWS